MIADTITLKRLGTNRADTLRVATPTVTTPADLRERMSAHRCGPMTIDHEGGVTSMACLCCSWSLFVAGRALELLPAPRAGR